MNRSRRILAHTLLLVSLWGGTQAGAAKPQPLQDTPFQQEFRQAQIRTANAEQNDVRAVAVTKSNTVWAATGAGAFSVEGEQLTAPAGQAIDGPTYDVVVDSADIVWVGAWDGVYRVTGGKLEQAGDLAGPITALANTPNGIIAAGPDGLFYWDQDHWEQRDAAIATSIRDVIALNHPSNTNPATCPLAVAASIGLYFVEGDKVHRVASEDGILSSDVRAVAENPNGELWVGTAMGIDVYNRGKRLRSITPQEGMPCADVHSIAFDAQGNAWIGTSLGLVRLSDDQWTLRHSLRWLPHDDVRDVALTTDGTAWIATAGGLSALASKPMTLADKAEHFDQLVRSRHVRPPGMVEKCRLKTPGDLSTYEDMDTDNDGSYTGMYVAAESFRYAVTGAEDARNNAAESMRALEFLHSVTETGGFFARTVVPSHWEQMADMNHEYMPIEIAERRSDEARFKPVNIRWRPSSDGKWLWKGDTSSDEVTGHYYTFGVYHDLVADETEKKRIAKLTAQLTDYIINGGYVLRDQDGEATRWGVWSPEKLNHDPNWRLDRGINSIEILSFLLTAHHLTGDKKYLTELEKLYNDHNYRQNILEPQQLDPGAFTHIDSELLAMAFRGLILYAVDPERKKVYEKSLEAWFAPVQDDASPFYAFTYAALGGERDIRFNQCVAHLRDLPLDMIQWTVDNRQREDISLVRRPSSELWQTDRLLPPSERAISRWDRNPYAALSGSGGAVEGSSVYWLLPYWMGRYYGFIESPKP